MVCKAGLEYKKEVHFQPTGNFLSPSSVYQNIILILRRSQASTPKALNPAGHSSKATAMCQLFFRVYKGCECLCPDLGDVDLCPRAHEHSVRDMHGTRPYWKTVRREEPGMCQHHREIKALEERASNDSYRNKCALYREYGTCPGYLDGIGSAGRYQ